MIKEKLTTYKCRLKVIFSMFAFGFVGMMYYISRFIYLLILFPFLFIMPNKWVLERAEWFLKNE